MEGGREALLGEPGAKGGGGGTSTRVAQRATRPYCDAGGAIMVPKDQRATPASSTVAPPSLRTAHPGKRGGHVSAIFLPGKESSGLRGMQTQQWEGGLLPRGKVAGGDLREGVAPEEGGGNEAAIGGAPAQLLGHGDHCHGHVYLKMSRGGGGGVKCFLYKGEHGRGRTESLGL